MRHGSGEFLGVLLYLLSLKEVVYSGSHAEDEGQKRISGKETSAMAIDTVSCLLALLPRDINQLIMCRRQTETGQRAPPRH